ncbi:hypothetical protein PVAP13_1NG538038 [Panicum virgatum]|uniref:Uncharacterized protein n=1 Tax=Panicum virgatum TaxID=38727 RepID=A0A8T0X1V4_PANVG|nr:hypothetical protein PVAP13_1NG538038 [Panicum virgatum]
MCCCYVLWIPYYIFSTSATVMVSFFCLSLRFHYNSNYKCHSVDAFFNNISCTPRSYRRGLFCHLYSMMQYELHVLNVFTLDGQMLASARLKSQIVQEQEVQISAAYRVGIHVVLDLFTVLLKLHRVHTEEGRKPGVSEFWYGILRYLPCRFRRNSPAQTSWQISGPGTRERRRRGNAHPQTAPPLRPPRGRPTPSRLPPPPLPIHRRRRHTARRIPRRGLPRLQLRPHASASPGCLEIPPPPQVPRQARRRARLPCRHRPRRS